MILAALFLALAVAASLAFPRRDTRDRDRGYRDIRDAARETEGHVELWRRIGERDRRAAKRETRTKVVKLREEKRA